MTFSIVARCARTGQLGAAVASSSPAVAARCISARAKVGSVASQNVTDPWLRNRALDLMEQGASAQQALEVICSSAAHLDYRQLMLLDTRGQTALFTGDKGLGIVAAVQAVDVACAGNLLSSVEVPARMLQSFNTSSGALCDRLLVAMQAGLACGGEAGPIHSAGVYVVDTQPWPIIDLRVDWAEDAPLKELQALWALFAPQVEGYVTRASNPVVAPSYGVPGES